MHFQPTQPLQDLFRQVCRNTPVRNSSKIRIICSHKSMIWNRFHRELSMKINRFRIGQCLWLRGNRVTLFRFCSNKISSKVVTSSNILPKKKSRLLTSRCSTSPKISISTINISDSQDPPDDSSPTPTRPRQIPNASKISA